MQPNLQPDRIVIVGGGVAGWMTAAVLCKGWNQGEGPSITVIESPRRAGVGVTELSCQPALRYLMLHLGVPESDWMRKCRATYKTNVRFVGWNGLPKHQDSFRHPLYCPGEDDNPELLRDWLHARHYEGFRQPFDTCFLSFHLAREQKAPKLNPQDYGRLDYSHHVDMGLFVDYMREWACQKGADHIVDEVCDVELDADGNIACLKTQQGRALFADTFIDCTGFKGLLISQTLGEPFISYSDQVFCDAAVAASAYPDNWERRIPSETSAVALSAGWCWEIPLLDRLGAGYVYSSHHLSPEAAERELRAHLGTGVKQSEARHIPMRVGRVRHAWVKNCVSIGLSASFIEPLEATSLFLIQFGAAQFIARLRHDSDPDSRRHHYNTLMREAYEGILDFIVMHYYLNGRDDSDFWKANRQRTSLPDSLQQILDRWRSGQGFDPLMRQSKSSLFFQLSSWYTILIGMRCLPGTGILAPAPQTPDDSASQHLHHRLRNLARAATPYPSHSRLLSSLSIGDN